MYRRKKVLGFGRVVYCEHTAVHNPTFPYSVVVWQGVASGASCGGRGRYVHRCRQGKHCHLFPASGALRNVNCLALLSSLYSTDALWHRCPAYNYSSIDYPVTDFRCNFSPKFSLTMMFSIMIVIFNLITVR